MNLHQIYAKILKASQEEKGIRIDSEGVDELKTFFEEKDFEPVKKLDFGEPYSIKEYKGKYNLQNASGETVGSFKGDYLYAKRIADSLNALQNIISPIEYIRTIRNLVRYFMTTEEKDPEVILTVVEAFIRSLRGEGEDFTWLEEFEKGETKNGF